MEKDQQISHPEAAAEDEEDEDQQCIYTYKGGDKDKISKSVADLPASFLQEFDTNTTTDLPNQQIQHIPHPSTSSSGIHTNLSLTNTNSSDNTSNLYSPEENLDFLDMDFDPGQEDHDDEEEIHKNLKNPVAAADLDEIDGNRQSEPEPVPSTSSSSSRAKPNSSNYKLNLSSRLVKSNTLPKMNTGQPQTPSTPTSASAIDKKKEFTLHTTFTHLSYSVPLIKGNDQDRADYQATLSMKSDSAANRDEEINFNVGCVMIWTTEEVSLKSVGQLGVSACGPTAVANVLAALGHSAIDSGQVQSKIHTKLRDLDADLPEYLWSRSWAGTTAEDLMFGLQELSGGEIYSKFFPIHKSCTKSAFNQWLLSWICKGAVPMVTRNLQILPTSKHCEIPDSWHHQMVYGVCPQGIYLTNPIELLGTESLLPQLKSDSILLIKREDVIGRCGRRTDLRKLARYPDVRWNELNVLGQVGQMLHEESALFNENTILRRNRTSHVKIPASYRAGVTLSILKSNDNYARLVKEEIL